MSGRVAVLGGDGVGIEVTEQAVKVVQVVEERFGLALELEHALFGGSAYEHTGSFCPDETVAAIERAPAVLLGAIGGPSWERGRAQGTSDGRGLLWLRRHYQLFANLRPIRPFPELLDVSPLKRERLEGTDLLILRELIGGLYFGEPRGDFEENGETCSRNAMVYRQHEIDQVMRAAFEYAMARRKRVTSVDKANVLDVSRFWRRRAEAIAADYPAVELDHYYVDVAAMLLITKAQHFDVIVTGNLFGDILSDEASVLVGSLGLLPSASLGPNKALYEPVHGSAPDIAGRDIANPLGAILSVGMMYRYTFERPDIENAIFEAIRQVIREHRTTDIMEEGKSLVGCNEMGDRVAAALQSGEG